jgi:hypothetical protein
MDACHRGEITLHCLAEFAFRVNPGACSMESPYLHGAWQLHPGEFGLAEVVQDPGCLFVFVSRVPLRFSIRGPVQKCRSFCEENGRRFVPHLCHSPALAPSDFFLFGYVKERVKGMVFPSYEELLDAIGGAVTGIESETLTAVFKHWMERLEWMRMSNGDYYP